MASLVRFERTTNCLEGSRSVRLSYRDKSNTHQKFSMSWKARSTPGAVLPSVHRCPRSSAFAEVALACFHGILSYRRPFDMPINVQANEHNDDGPDERIEGAHYET